ncbi:MAG: hypothetical protein ACOYJQ_18635 [Pseudochelatococcus sp.]|jgi:hypothetical protein|uniref:hypothetical protein n=1 Tax=Pseudochelatococcus sp. TaxID=2020869 RepID=UPI003D8A1BD2
MNIRQFAALSVMAAAVMILAACTSTGGNTSLNSQAITAYAAPQVKSSLGMNRKRLAACIAQQAAKQRMSNAARLDTDAIASACQSYELAYRTSVMAHVRPEWRRPEVLNNTANTSTRNLYTAILELFQ